MTALSLSISPSPRSILAELLERQRALAVYGLALLPLALTTLVAQAFDPRLLNGLNVWVKPTKFFASVAIFALTAAWLFGYVRPERRRAPVLRATVAMIIVAGSFELAWISWQASQGLASHFNGDTSLYAAMYIMMGIFSVLLVGTTLPLAWEIGRRPAAGLPSDFVAAVVVGLLLTFLLGGGLGGYMGSQPGHSVGVEGGHVPMFGWNRSGGDLRVAHFLGIHAEQAIPLLAAMVAGWSAAARWRVLIAGTVAYVLATLAVFIQAVSGAPLLPF